MAERSNGNAKMLVRFWLGAPFFLGEIMKKRFFLVLAMICLALSLTSCKSVENDLSKLERNGYTVTSLTDVQKSTIQKSFLSSNLEVYVLDGFLITKKNDLVNETAQLIKLNSKNDARKIIDLYDKLLNNRRDSYHQIDEYVVYGHTNIVKYFK